MSRIIFLLSLCALLFPARAEERMDRLTVGSKNYTNVVVVGFNVTDVYFKHDGGVSNVRLKYLSPELQEKFFYDPNNAARAEREQIAGDAGFGETLARAEIEWRERKRAADAQPPIEAEIIDPLGKESLLGTNAPAFKPDDWVTDKPETENKFQLLFIWSSASTACKRVIPDLNELAKNLRDQLIVIGVSSDSKAALEEFTEPKIEFPLACDSKSKLARELRVTSIPSVVLLDAKGIIRYQGHPAALNGAVLKALFVKFANKD